MFRNLKSDWSLVQRKNKVDFFKAFLQSSFKVSFFYNNFLHAVAVLKYLPKVKRSLGLAFGAHFLHDFSIKFFSVTLSMDKISMSYLFSFPRYRAKCVIKFLFRQLDDVIKFKIYLGSTFQAMADREKKRG